MRIYLKIIYADFHPDPIWNKEALGFFENGRPNKNNNHNNKVSNMESVADLKKTEYLLSIIRLINPTDVAAERSTCNINVLTVMLSRPI